ncbi:MAG: beta-aspartyl-peptidase [Solobacterium sp.]|jgi:beta-aspartyl-dipeptidase (metallo-type)|nr:beta-aspartyl-peptidase [Solobacterium sp.]MCH4223302.1 beta-aspartyl-peptidase [Solobacterium sp.]
MLLMKQADLYAPEHLGIKDVLIEGEKILSIQDHIELSDPIDGLQVIQADHKLMIPGFIDLHEHIIGGGGEGGPWLKTPEASLKTLLSCGVTTVVGLLGTDGISRNLTSLIEKARAFNHDGITAYILTGSYGYPPVTFFDSVEKDIMLMDLVVGVKTAMSDHRSSAINGEELIHLAANARRGGLLAGKPGYVTIHMGSGAGMLDPLFYALDHSDIPVQIFQPTHMGRTAQLLDQGIEFQKRGGTIDITAGEDAAHCRETADQLEHIFQAGFEDQVTVTTDAYGSMPKFNEQKELIGMTYGIPDGLLNTLAKLVLEKHIPLETALKPFTANPAHVLQQSDHKGHISAGADADLLLLNSDMTLDTVIARGTKAYGNHTALLHGQFE